MHSRRWSNFAGVLLALLVIFSLVRTARAEGIVIEGGAVPAGQVLSQNAVLVGDAIYIDGTVEGDVMAVGNTITVNGDVQGSLIAAGQTILINGGVAGSVYASGLRVELGETAQIGHDLYAASVDLVTQPGANIGRDLNALAFGANLAGEVDRNVNAVVGIMQLGDVLLDAIQGPDRQPLLPFRSYLAPTLYTVAPAPLAATMVAWNIPGGIAQTGGIDGERLGAWFLTFLEQWLTMAAFAGLALLIFPALFQRWTERVRYTPLASSAWGLVGVVFGYSAAILLAVVILPIALFLFRLQLGDLGLSVMILGYTGLGFAFTLFWILVSFVSQGIVAYLAGWLILNRFAPQSLRYRVLPLLLGTFLLALLVSIPTIGWIIGLIASLLGVGAVVKSSREERLTIEPLPA